MVSLVRDAIPRRCVDARLFLPQRYTLALDLQANAFPENPCTAP